MSGFKSVAKTGTASYPPLATPGQRAEFWLHGSGGANFTYGDTYTAIGDASMGINDNMPFVFHTQNGGGYYSTLPNPTVPPYVLIQPVDHVAAPGTSPSPMETNWAGYKHNPTPKVAHLYTHAELDGLYAWAIPGGGLPMVDPMRVALTGNSMGGWGGMHWGLRRPNYFAAIQVTQPRFRHTALNDWETGLASSYAIDPALLPDGTSWDAFMDMVAYIANPANPLPPVMWGIGKQDVYSSMQEQQEAVAAMIATNRVFAFVAINGTHSTATASAVLSRLQASYKLEMFVRGQGAPVLRNSTLDTPFTADVVGINLGFKWQILAEAADQFVVALQNVLGTVTVDVLPCSTVFTASVAAQTVTIPAGQSVTVTFRASAGQTTAAPTITGFSVSPTALPAGGGDVTVDATVAGADAVTVNGVEIPALPYTLEVTQSETVALVASNPGGTTPASADVTVAPITDDDVGALLRQARAHGWNV